MAGEGGEGFSLSETSITLAQAMREGKMSVEY